MLFLIILLALIYYFVIYKKSSVVQDNTVSCDEESDDLCKMYNQRDIQTKCSAMCTKKSPKHIFAGKYKKEGSEHVCECELSQEKFTLDFSNFGENPDVIPDTIPDDSKFSNRNYLEQEQEKRFNKLIFG